MSVVAVEGLEFYAEDAGSGMPVLLLHGGFCSLESMRPQAEALAADHRVLAFERPGHGRTADVEGDYSYAESLAWTLSYLDAVDSGPVHVVGYSDGAILGLMLATRHPERVRSLVAISANLDPSAFTFSPEAEQPGAVVLGPARADETSVGEQQTADANEPNAERVHYARLSPDGPAHADAVLAKLLRLWTTEPHLDPADLARIAVPTLIMAGDRDTIRLDHTLAIAAAIPGAQLAVVPGTSHGLIAEAPDLVTTLLRRFLAA
jgi:pimeloyl-ACP methyl ester carboxylesterase